MCVCCSKNVWRVIITCRRRPISWKGEGVKMSCFLASSSSFFFWCRQVFFNTVLFFWVFCAFFWWWFFMKAKFHRVIGWLNEWLVERMNQSSIDYCIEIRIVEEELWVLLVCYTCNTNMIKRRITIIIKTIDLLFHEIHVVLFIYKKKF